MQSTYCTCSPSLCHVQCDQFFYALLGCSTLHCTVYMYVNWRIDVIKTFAAQAEKVRELLSQNISCSVELDK